MASFPIHDKRGAASEQYRATTCGCFVSIEFRKQPIFPANLARQP